MKNIKATGEAICESRKELALKYFNACGDGVVGVYGLGNTGIVSLLSDLQELIGTSNLVSKEHYRQILNDIKCILITDERANEQSPLTQITKAIEQPQQKKLSAGWCNCGKPEFLCYPDDGECNCGVHKHHVHCANCGAISQVG